MSFTEKCKHDVVGWACNRCFQEVNDSFMAMKLEEMKESSRILSQALSQEEPHINSPEFLRIT